MSANLRKNSFKLFKNPEKNNSWADLGPRSARHKLSQMFVPSGEIPSPGQTSSDKTNDCAIKSERRAPVRGSDPPSGHSVHTTTGDRWRAPARRLIETHLAASVYKTGSIPLRWQKIVLFSGLREERWTPRATSRPLDHGST